MQHSVSTLTSSSELIVISAPVSVSIYIIQGKEVRGKKKEDERENKERLKLNQKERKNKMKKTEKRRKKSVFLENAMSLQDLGDYGCPHIGIYISR